MSAGMEIPFLSLGLGDDRADVEAAIARVVERGWFVLGPEVEAFEAAFAAACGARHAVGVNTGTDALMLSLRALDIGPGDEVITTPLTAAYTALAIRMAGATPVFADVDPVRCTIDPAAIAAAVTPRTRAVVPVHLYGQPADMAAIMAVAGRHRLAVVEDCAQAHLATAEGRPVGTIGTLGAFSFYPTKNLGALGDAGAIVTDDASLAERVKRLRNGGQSERYRHVDSGVNSRLDEMQAAVLRARLPRLPGWTARRRALASRYRATLSSANLTVLPERDSGHVYHLFTVHSAHRDELQRSLAGQGIGTLVHYPIPVHRQPAFAELPPAHCPEADAISATVLSLPLHPALVDDDVGRVARAVNQFAESSVGASGPR
jgi:dTDP-3-amino-3,4,6-trideoxy-alpha-D-glucose transaminase